MCVKLLSSYSKLFGQIADVETAQRGEAENAGETGAARTVVSAGVDTPGISGGHGRVIRGRYHRERLIRYDSKLEPRCRTYFWLRRGRGTRETYRYVGPAGSRRRGIADSGSHCAWRTCGSLSDKANHQGWAHALDFVERLTDPKPRWRHRRRLKNCPRYHRADAQ